MSHMKATILVVAALLYLFPMTALAAGPAEKRPNILLILGDDMGYSDLGCYGGEAKTPNLDSLAAKGVRFTQFYNGARCCPTRASLLTGLYAHETGIGHMTHNDRGFPGYRADLNNQCVTIAEVLGDAGYRTYMVGKWHIQRNERPEGPKYNWARQRGFEKYYGLIWGSSSFFDPAICRDNTWYSRESDPEYKSDEYYLTDALSDNAVTFLQQHQKESPDKPFFMYAAYTAAHWPMHAREKDIAKYKGRFDAGYDKLRQERLTRLIDLGLIDPKWKPAQTAGNWDSVENREWELRCMEVYAAMIDSLDQGIGKILAELKRQGQLENTMILFLQDNGACAEDVGRRAGPQDNPNKKFPPLKPEDLPNGSRHPKQTRDGRPVLHGPIVMPGGENSYIAYGLNWANVSNTPFREYKHWVHEGGIATPLIVHWPDGIGHSRENKLVKDPAHIIDIMATCVDVAQTSYPAARKGVDIKPMRGVSLVPTLRGDHLKRSEPLCWEHESNRAIRDGKWKLVAFDGKPWELYDMESDRTERNNLAKANPELVKELAAKWDAWAAKSNVLPLGGWKEPQQRGSGGANRVTLKQGQIIPAKESPQVQERPFSITVEVKRPQGDGVLLAHGGNQHGYALYVENGKLTFAIRRGGELRKLSDASPLGTAATTLVASVDSHGAAVLIKDGKPVAEQSNFGLLARTPADDLSASLDYDKPVGDYNDEFRYNGELGQITLEVGGPR